MWFVCLGFNVLEIGKVGYITRNMLFYSIICCQDFKLSLIS